MAKIQALDIFSRYIVGWMVATKETSELAQAQALRRPRDLHPPPTGHHGAGGTARRLRSDLTIYRRINPFSEAVNKTLKYCPAFPARFGSIEDARAFCAIFVEYYNHQHRHSGIGLHTPASVHYGTATQIRAARVITLDAAYAANPARFGNRRPSPPRLPTAAWINKPTIHTDTGDDDGEAQKKS